MWNSGLDRAGLPETESLTSQRSGQGSKTTEGRKGAPRAHADLEGENDVIRWVDTATHTPTTPPHPVLRQAKRRSDQRSARVAWKVTARRQSLTSGQDQARRRAPGTGIPVSAAAKSSRVHGEAFERLGSANDRLAAVAASRIGIHVVRGHEN